MEPLTPVFTVVPVLLMDQWIKDSHVGLCVLSTQLKATFGAMSNAEFVEGLLRRRSPFFFLSQ